MTRVKPSLTAFLARGINAPLVVGTLALAADPTLYQSSYRLRLMTVAGIYALLVIGYQFIFGHAGALSLAQGTFFGLGKEHFHRRCAIGGMIGVHMQIDVDHLPRTRALTTSRYFLSFGYRSSQ